MLIQILGSLQLGFLYAIMALGVYVTFRILNIPDLTVDGTFSFGMAVSAVVTVAGHPVLAIFAGMAAGILAGFITGFLQTKVSIHPILAGILTMTGLYSVNLFVMGAKSNLSLVGNQTLFTMFDTLSPLSADTDKLLLSAVICVIAVAVLAVFFHTRLGISIRATGDNEEMVRSSSINASLTKCIALALSNACVGISGALICQYQMFSDATYGSGMVVIGLASVIIGETLIGKRSVTLGLISACTGSVIYRIIIAFALKFEIFPSYALKLISAVIVAVALSIPSIKTFVQNSKLKRKAEKNNVR